MSFKGQKTELKKETLESLQQKCISVLLGSISPVILKYNKTGLDQLQGLHKVDFLAVE